jgi:hypothetical protein
MPMIAREFLPEDVQPGDKIVIKVSSVSKDMVDLSYEDAEVIKSEENNKQESDEDPKTMPLTQLRKRLTKEDEE